MCSCSSAKHAVEITEHSVHDTLYLNKVQYDSIFIQNDHSQEYHNSTLKLSETVKPSETIVDTVFIKDKSVEYKYRLLRDTTYVHKVDTIPVIKTVEITKTERYVPSIYKWSLGICIALVLLLILWLVLKFVFKR